MIEHYSKGLRRNFEDNDWLTITEVKEVISANSNRVVGSGTVGSFLRRAENIQKREVNSQVKLYLYKDIKDVEIADHRGRRLLDDPSDLVLRQRRFQERKRLKKDQVDQADAASR